MYEEIRTEFDICLVSLVKMFINWCRHQLTLYSHLSYQCEEYYSITTTAPNVFNVSIIFSASSFGTPSFIIFGALSTNFLESTNDNPNMLLISLITFGLLVVSKDCSLRLKRVFSWAAGAGSSSSIGAAAGGPAAEPAAIKPPIGISGRLRRVWDITN